MKKRSIALVISLCFTPVAFAKHKGEVDCTEAGNASVAECSDPAAIAKAARIKAAKDRMAKMAQAPAPEMDHSKMQGMEGMDHSKMPGMEGMDHSKMQGMEGMDHSKMEGMDHSKMQGMDPAAIAKAARIKAAKDRMAKMAQTSAPEMDHSKMPGMEGMAGMDHSKMPGMEGMADMDHSKMPGMEGMAGMDHSKMPGMEGMAGMDHSKMPGMEGMAGMDHSKMPGMEGMAGMDHSKMERTIPVSDGGMDVNVPLPFPGAMHMEDDPFVTKIMIDALQIGRNENGTDTLVLEADAWLGYDLNKLWFKTDLEMSDGKLEGGELQALYSRGVSPYWDIQAGVRKDFKPVGREWAVIGLRGTAPYWFDIDASLAVGKNGQTNARLNAEYELMLTQKVVLEPSLGLSFYGKDDEEAGVGSGVSQATVGLNLGYQIKREFTPYVGVSWAKKFGDTADYARAEGEDASDTQFVLGIKAWF